MRKNKSTIYTFLFFFLFIILFVPAILSAQEETGAEEETAEELGPGPLWTLIFFPVGGVFMTILKASFLVLLKLFPVVAIASVFKIRVLKRKLSLPWKSIEKLSITTFSETVVEMTFFLFFMFFFTPAIASLLKNIGFTGTTSEIGLFLKFIAHTLVAIPYQCVLGAVLSLLLLHLVTPMSLKELRQYFKFGAFLALIPPVTLIVFIFFTRILLKWNYI